MTKAGTESLANRVSSAIHQPHATARRLARTKVARRLRVAAQPVKRALRPQARRLAQSKASASRAIAERAGRINGRRAAEVTYFAVLSGHNLNLQAVLPPSADGYADVASLAFSRNGRSRHGPVRIRTDRDGNSVAEATVLLGELAGRLPLSTGTWRMHLDIVRADGRSRRLLLHRAAGPMDEAGPTFMTQPCPDTGAFFRTGVNALGLCRIVVEDAVPRAEVRHVSLSHSSARVTGRLVAVPQVTTGRFELRNGTTVLRVDTDLSDGRFDITVPLSKMFPTADHQHIWDISLVLPARPPVPVGRYLHDLRKPRDAYREIERLIALPGDRTVFVRPKYKADGRLTLACRRDDQGANE